MVIQVIKSMNTVTHKPKEKETQNNLRLDKNRCTLYRERGNQ